MNPASDGSAPAVLDALGSGLPMLLLQFLLVLALLVAGISIYMAVTPFHERELLRNGNPAAATVLGGALVALASRLPRFWRLPGRSSTSWCGEWWRSSFSY
jgi:hypothetical protein